MLERSEQRTWWSSNWKWVVPVGCVVGFFCFAVFLAGILAIVVGSVRSSWAFKEGTALAAGHTGVVAALGEPITAGWLTTGNVEVNGSSGNADLSIPLRGPQGRATLYVIATKRAGEWSFELAEVAVRGRGDRIDLLDGSGIWKSDPREAARDAGPRGRSRERLPVVALGASFVLAAAIAPASAKRPCRPAGA